MSRRALGREVGGPRQSTEREGEPGTAVRGLGEVMKVLAVRLSSSAASDQLELLWRTRGCGVGRDRRRLLPVEVSELDEEDREREASGMSVKLVELRPISTGTGDA